tara:strand:- start:5432 stop:5662 length:231 start_codon:yes stop_codon:yes gene_type:complete
MTFLLSYFQFLNKHISYEIINEMEYLVLTIPEHNTIEYYRSDKYFIYELIQDYDAIKYSYGIKTNYFKHFYPEFYD